MAYTGKSVEKVSRCVFALDEISFLHSVTSQCEIGEYRKSEAAKNQGKSVQIYAGCL